MPPPGMAGAGDCFFGTSATIASVVMSNPAIEAASCSAVRVKIRDGRLAIGSLASAGFASGAYPDWAALRPVVSPQLQRTASA